MRVSRLERAGRGDVLLPTGFSGDGAGRTLLLKLQTGRLDMPRDEALAPFVGIINRDRDPFGRDGNDRSLKRKDETTPDALQPDDLIAGLKRVSHRESYLMRIRSAPTRRGRIPPDEGTDGRAGSRRRWR